jgi:hypothetical protein
MPTSSLPISPEICSSLPLHTPPMEEKKKEGRRGRMERERKFSFLPTQPPLELTSYLFRGRAHHVVSMTTTWLLCCTANVLVGAQGQRRETLQVELPKSSTFDPNLQISHQNSMHKYLGGKWKVIRNEQVRWDQEDGSGWRSALTHLPALKEPSHQVSSSRKLREKNRKAIWPFGESPCPPPSSHASL